MMSSSVILATTGFIGAYAFPRARAVPNVEQLPRDLERLQSRKTGYFTLALQRFTVTGRAASAFHQLFAFRQAAGGT
jgi:hypothetical protein